MCSLRSGSLIYIFLKSNLPSFTGFVINGRCFFFTDIPSKPKGIVVAMLVNLQGVSDIEEIGKNIALQIYKAVNC